MTTKLSSIKLLSKTYDIKCPESEENNLQQAAHKLNTLVLKQKSKFQKIDDFQALLLAALTISHEVISSQLEQESQRLQMTQFINSLETRINQVVEGETR